MHWDFHSQAKIKADDVEDRMILLESQASQQALLYLNYSDVFIPTFYHLSHIMNKAGSALRNACLSCKITML